MVKDQFLLTQPTKREPNQFLEGALGAAALFEKVTVEVNGYPVTQEQMQEWGYIYQVINRTYMNREDCVRKYGRDFPRVSTSLDGAIATDGKMPQDLKDSMQSLEFDAPVKGSKKILSFGADGIWPFDSGSNLLAAMTGREPAVNGYLPPEMSLCIKLHKRDDFETVLQRPGVLDTVTYDPATAAGEIHDNHKITWVLSDLVLQYESIRTDDATMASMKAKTEYYVDIPRIIVSKVASGNSVSNNEISVPPGTRMVVLTWMFTDHVYSKPDHKKPLAARFHFPLNATKLTVGWEGQPSLIFSHGFEEIGTEKAAGSLTSSAYHSSVVHRRLYGRGFEKMFPVHPARTYDGCLIFDMSAQKLDSNSKLLVNVRYDKEGGGRQYFLVSTLVQQCHFLYKHDEPMKYTTLL